jgi:hypothetical protein
LWLTDILNGRSELGLAGLVELKLSSLIKLMMSGFVRLMATARGISPALTTFGQMMTVEGRPAV